MKRIFSILVFKSSWCSYYSSKQNEKSLTLASLTTS